jgi:hypothetical protein
MLGVAWSELRRRGHGHRPAAVVHGRATGRGEEEEGGRRGAWPAWPCWAKRERERASEQEHAWATRASGWDERWKEKGKRPVLPNFVFLFQKCE